MDNATRFLNSFTRIEMEMKKLLKMSNERFSTMIYQLSKTNPYIKEKRQFLEEMAQLRNAIVHTRVGKLDEVIAQPHDLIVKEIETIARHLVEPPILKSLTKKGVTCVDSKMTVQEILKILKTTGFSVLPVYEGSRYLGCIHALSFVNYLATVDSVIDLSTLTVSNLLSVNGSSSRVMFMAQDQTVYDILSVYEDLHSKGKSLIAIIVTKSGFQNEKPISIFTHADLPQLFVELE